MIRSGERFPLFIRSFDQQGVEASAAFRNGCTSATRPRCDASPAGCRCPTTPSPCSASTTARSLQLPYTERRALLEDLGLDTTTWRMPPSFPGPAVDVVAASAQHGLEGIVAKCRVSTYRPGQRSPDWRKVKHQRMQKAVISGWRPGQGQRAGRIGSLILGIPDEHGKLQHVGGVGTGFTERMLDQLGGAAGTTTTRRQSIHDPAARSRDPRCSLGPPDLVGEVAYIELTGDGHATPLVTELRHGLRSQDAVMSEREATRAGLPDLVRPMLAIAGELPAANEDGRWAYELKWDGVRAVGYVQDGTTRLMSRNDLDFSVSYPEVLEPPAPVRQRGLVLDGEL